MSRNKRNRRNKRTKSLQKLSTMGHFLAIALPTAFLIAGRLVQPTNVKRKGMYMPDAPAVFTIETIVNRIHEFRGVKVMLDSDLAVLYGVTTKALLQAVKRNADKFPADFMFQMSDDEWTSLRSQYVTSKGRGGRRYAPYAFTEHGALMLSSVLNSRRATEISLMVIRAFVWLRQAVPGYEELASKVAELENAVGKHDEALGGIIEALQQLLLPPGKEKRRIGF